MKRLWRKLRVNKYFLRHVPYEFRKDFIEDSRDPGRYAVIKLAIARLQRENIPGAFAEVGVYRGLTSKRIHQFDPQRTLYLFDTFEGFAADDLDDDDRDDGRFANTSIELVKRNIGNMDNVVIRKGYFPETAKGLEDERFAFVMLDVDKHKPTVAGLEFFYERMTPGGYIFVHDYNSSESDWAVSQAVDGFMRDKPEHIIEFADKCGSVALRKSAPAPLRRAA